MSAYNLPRGVMVSDIDPPVCPECEGCGEVEISVMGLDGFYRTCAKCGGLGVPNTRTKAREVEE